MTFNSSRSHHHGNAGETPMPSTLPASRQRICPLPKLVPLAIIMPLLPVPEEELHTPIRELVLVLHHVSASAHSPLNAWPASGSHEQSLPWGAHAQCPAHLGQQPSRLPQKPTFRWLLMFAPRRKAWWQAGHTDSRSSSWWTQEKIDSSMGARTTALRNDIRHGLSHLLFHLRVPWGSSTGLQ